MSAFAVEFFPLSYFYLATQQPIETTHKLFDEYTPIDLACDGVPVTSDSCTDFL